MVEITAELVRGLIDGQFPAWRELKIRPVEKSGNDNRTFHLGERLMVRLPSNSGYVPQVEKEARWLPVLAEGLSLPVTCPVAKGEPTKEYPFAWSVNSYVEGETVNEENVPDRVQFAKELGAFLKELQGIGTEGAPRAGAHNFYRGASPLVYQKEVEKALEELKEELPVEKIRGIWDKSVALEWDKAPVWIHGDIACGNLLVQDGHLCGVIDFGIMGVGDPACDYAMAWTFFEKGESREAFLAGLDSATIDRARGWALWKALITYYAEKKEVRENARNTIKAILEE